MNDDDIKRCPFCGMVNAGIEGNCIKYCCSAVNSFEPYYHCEGCNTKWRTITEEIIIGREVLKNE